jgi:RPA family protein
MDLRDAGVWAAMEQQAYEGTANLAPLPPPAYKYFAELTAVYYAFRFEGMPKEDAESRKRMLLKAYQRDIADLHRAREIFAEYQENVKKSELCRTEIEKAEDAVTIAAMACEIIEALTGETGFAARQKRKIGGI